MAVLQFTSGPTTTLTHDVCPAALPKLAFANPSLAGEWHPKDNGSLTPADVSVGSSQKVSWLCTACPCGHPHIWKAAVGMRARGGKSGCPYCAGKKPCVCKSLARLRPSLANEWDYPSNAPLRPEDVTVASNKRVTWFCDAHAQPHFWSATVYSRTKPQMPSGCPLCSNTQKNTKTSTHLHVCLLLVLAVSGCRHNLISVVQSCHCYMRAPQSLRCSGTPQRIHT